MKHILFLILMLTLHLSSIAQRSKSRTAYSNPDFTPELTTYDQQLFALNYNSMIYWYNTAMEIDSVYQLEKLKTHYYAKITGVQANSYEALQSVYDNKQAIDKAIADEKEQAVNELKKRNRKLVTHNVVLSVGLTALAFTTCYLAIF
jgi:hypothetical protein